MANIIITGSSRGIGFEMAKLFADEGHQVLALSRNDAPILALNHQNITAFPFDISSQKDLDIVSDFISSTWHQVDILINNAGKLLNKPFLEISEKEFQEVI